MMTESLTEAEFEQYARYLGYSNVSMDADVLLINGAEIIAEYLDDHRDMANGTVKLRDIYNQLLKIKEVAK